MCPGYLRHSGPKTCSQRGYNLPFLAKFATIWWPWPPVSAILCGHIWLFLAQLNMGYRQNWLQIATLKNTRREVPAWLHGSQFAHTRDSRAEEQFGLQRADHHGFHRLTRSRYFTCSPRYYCTACGNVSDMPHEHFKEPVQNNFLAH